MGTWIQLISLSAGLLGLLLLLRGLLGRRVGTAPHCRNCRFDLTGLYPEHQVCPECGATLVGPRATTRGARYRSWPLAAIGVLLLASLGTLGTLTARGVITKGKVANVLPTRTLIVLAVDHPHGWISDECADELLRRVIAGNQSQEESLRLIDALIAAFSRPDFPEYERHLELLEYLLMEPRTPTRVRWTYVDFLLDRVVRTDLPWMDAWGDELLTHREEGYISDERWAEVVTELITPRLWCSSGDVVEPGEVFVLRMNFLSARIKEAPGVSYIAPKPVAGVRRAALDEPMAAFPRAVSGVPAPSLISGELLVAGDAPFSGEFAVRVWYAPNRSIRTLVDPSAWLDSQETLTAESRQPISVRRASSLRVEPPQSIAQWLQTNLLPVLAGRRRTTNRVLDAPFDCVISLLAPTGDLALSGEVVAVARSAKRSHVGRFHLTRVDDIENRVWVGVTHQTSRSFGGNYQPETVLPQFNIELPTECLLPGARALLLFDHVTLPDGRTFDANASGAAPIEIEVPLDPDAGGFHW